MTTPDDNPYAPPSYPAPSGQAFAFPDPEERVSVVSPQGSGGSVVSPPVMGAPTEPVGALTEPVVMSSGRTNPSARRALWLALMTPVLTPVVGIAAIAIGRRSRDEVIQTGEGGAGLAGAAIWLGGILSILWTLGVAFLVAMKAGSIAG